jgi:hypothetical protein
MLVLEVTREAAVCRVWLGEGRWVGRVWGSMLQKSKQMGNWVGGWVGDVR